MLIFLDIVNRAVAHAFVHLLHGGLFHTVARVFYFNVKQRILQINPYINPTGRSLFFHAVYTGILHKSRKRQFRDIVICAVCR